MTKRRGKHPSLKPKIRPEATPKQDTKLVSQRRKMLRKHYNNKYHVR